VAALETLLAKWKSVQIVLGFFRFMLRRWDARQAAKNIVQVAGPGELKSAFFDEKVYIGHTVRLRGRLTQYCPIYFPDAYSPQAHFSDPSGRFWELRYNPAPTTSFTRSGVGATLAFLFEEASDHTPRLVSPYHPDRTQPIPFHLTDPGVPILIDTPSERFLEQLVEVQGVLTRLDESISNVIDESDEEVVKLYYHTFYKADFFPNKGYVVDARAASGGIIKPLSDVAPFFTSVAVELQYSTRLTGDEVETVVQAQLRRAYPESAGPARYQPAYYTPPGYRIVQLPLGNIITHVAPELGVLNVATVIDTTNPDRDHLGSMFLPTARGIVDALRKEDSGIHLQGLFSSDPEFYRTVGVSKVELGK